MINRLRYNTNRGMVLDECVSIKAPKARFFKEPLAFKPEFVLSNEIENAEKNIILS